MLTVTNRWEELFEGESLTALAETLPIALKTKRWFGGKARQIAATSIAEVVPFELETMKSILLLVQVAYADGGRETYQLPVTAAFGDEATSIRETYPQAILTAVTVGGRGRRIEGLLYDAMWNGIFAYSLLHAIERGAKFFGKSGTVAASPTNSYPELVRSELPLDPAVMKGEQSNTSVAFGEQVILKLYRRLEEGTSPDFEIGRALTGMRFPYVPAIAGAIEYRRTSGEPVTLGLLQRFVRNDGDAWRHSLDAVDRFMLRILGGQTRYEPPPQAVRSLLDVAREEYHPMARKLIGLYLESAERLGRRTAELHVALSQVSGDPAFVPEPLGEEYRQACYDRMAHSASDTFNLLQQRISHLSEIGQAKARRIFDQRTVIDRIYTSFRDLDIPVARIRCHGDYHLGQVLSTGPDFMIIDFEGEPARPLVERRMKHPAMVDVAGMVRSFHYAPFAFLEGKRKGVAVASHDVPQQAILWARFWATWTSGAFLKAYLSIANGTRFWPQDEKVVRLLFNVYVIEKAVYELGYELNNRPDWVEIPLGGLHDIVESLV